jgi:predicted polyphosphate/ATP-dependent NAD kinase
VKIHSAVFATTPVNAGELAAAYVRGDVTRLREVEVLDLDEEAVRSGTVAPRLYGYLKIPFERMRVQGLKVASTTGEAASLADIAAAVVEQMDDNCLYIIGPGTTTRAITDKLGLRKTLIGVDVVTRRGMVAEDANEAQILKLIEGRRAKIIVTPVGGQGCIFGRGNQQISARVIAKVGRDNIVVVGTPDKVQSLAGLALWVDTGDPDTDRMLQGYVRVVTGYKEEIVIRVGN